MGDFTSLTRANATSTGTWSRDGMICSYQIHTPDNPHGSGHVSGYTAPAWPVVFFRMGGANMNPADLDLGTNNTYLALANQLSCVIVAYDVTPGGFYLPGVVDPRAKFFPENFSEDALAIIHFRNHAADATYWGTGNSITTDPDRSMHAGLSSGGWRVLKTQLSQDGDFDYIADPIQRGESRFAKRHSHCCNFVLANQPQVLMSTFCMSKFSAAVQAIYDGDPDATLCTYLANGAAAAGASSFAIDGDSVVLIKGNRVQVWHSTAYVTSGTQSTGANTLAVAGAGDPIPLGASVGVTIAGTKYSSTLRSAYAGGAGSIPVTASAWGATVSIPAGTAVKVVYTYAVAQDFQSGSLSVKPSLQWAVTDNDELVLGATALEKYSADTGTSTNGSWCSGYYFPSTSGYIWQDDVEVDDAAAVFPWELKRQGDVDNMISADNPRVTEATWIFIGSMASTDVTSAITGERSFLAHAPAPWGTLADGTIDASHFTLHGDHNQFLAAYALDAAGNTEDVLLYVGNTTSNPDTEVGATNWNKGQNADFDSTVLIAALTERGFA